MRLRLALALALTLLALGIPSAARAATDTQELEMNFQVLETLVCVGGLLDEPPASLITQEVINFSIAVACHHNRGTVAPMWVDARIDKSSPYYWVGYWDLSLEGQTLQWWNGTFGTTQRYPSTVSNPGSRVMEFLGQFWVDLSQVADHYTFTITLTFTTV